MSDSSCRGSEIATVPGSDERPGSALVQTLVQQPGLAKRQGFPYHIHPTTSQSSPWLILANLGFLQAGETHLGWLRQLWEALQGG